MPVASTIPAAISAFAARLRFPQLFLLTAALFVLDLLIPDLIPLADEVLLGLLTMLFGTWRRDSSGGSKPPTKDVTPRAPGARGTSEPE